MALSPGTRLGPYEILGALGAGGMGEVYRARDARLQRDVAIKVLPASFAADPDRLRRFEQEVRATGQLNHPNILAVYDTGTHDGVPYVVEELLEGDTLRVRLAGAPLPVRKTLDYARQIAHGLAAAHQKGIVHRDLKPENLFVTSDGRIKILDFGLARWSRPEAAAGAAAGAARAGGADSGGALTALPTETGTGVGVVLGTVGYMSPEQVRAQPVDQRSDIFSFGGILYEMLSGRRAFSGPSSVETLNAILKEEPPDISRTQPDMPAGLERIVQHCLEKSPDERFQSARDLAFQFEALSTSSAPGVAGVGAAGAMVAPGAGTVDRPGTAGGRAAFRTRAALVPALVVAVLGAAAAVAAYFAGMRHRPPEAPVTYSQLTFRQGSILTGRFSPDGGTVIYAAAWDGQPATLFTTRVGSPESRALDLPPSEILSVSASGEMAILLNPHFTTGWMRSGTLARAPLSGGVPREVLDDVQDADWSPDGKDLAVIRSVHGRYRLEFPTGKVLYTPEQWISSLRFSRDGRSIGFVEHPWPGDNRGHVMVTDLEGHAKPLTEDFSSIGGLAWSARGEEIWFTAGTIGTVRAVHAVDRDGHQRVVDRAPADMMLADVTADGRALVIRHTSRRGLIGTRPGDPMERDLSWLDWSIPAALSPDGVWLLFTEEGQGGGADYSVYLRKTDGSPAVRLGTGNGVGLSRDGRWAIATSTSEAGRLDFLPVGTGEARRIKLPGLNIASARFLPGDTRLLVNASEAGHLQREYVVDATGGTPQPITPEGVGYFGVLSPDAARLAVNVAGHAARIVPIAGGEMKDVPGSLPDDVPIAWSSDGGSLYVSVREGPAVRVDRIDLRTGRRAAWKTLIPADRAGVVDVGFVLMTPDARAHVYSYRCLLSTLYHVDGLR